MRQKEKIIRWSFSLAGKSAIIILLAIFFFLLVNGVDAFQEISVAEFLGKIWKPDGYEKAEWGVLGLLLSTLLVAGGGIIFALPLGLATAVYLAEFCPDKLREILKPAIEMIAGIPSVVLGLLGLLVLAPLTAKIFGLHSGLNAFTTSVIVGIMTLPAIITITEDVITSLPRNYHEASHALGATKWQTVRRVLLPAARSGIVAVVMLGVGRAVGETMAVLMVAGNARAFPTSFLDPVRPLTATIAIEIKEVVQGGLHYHALFTLGLVLFAITFFINFCADVLLERRKKEYGE